MFLLCRESCIHSVIIHTHTHYNRIGKILEFEDVTATGWPGDSAEDVDEVFDALVEANDCLLERVVCHGPSVGLHAS